VSDPGPESISIASSGISIAESTEPNRPKRVMGFRGPASLLCSHRHPGLRWIATAAAAGPSSILIWIGAWLAFYTPLALSVIETFRRAIRTKAVYYVWSKRAFGDFSGFMAAWTYWTSNLAILPGCSLISRPVNVLFMRQAEWGYLSAMQLFTSLFRY